MQQKGYFDASCRCRAKRKLGALSGFNLPPIRSRRVPEIVHRTFDGCVISSNVFPCVFVLVMRNHRSPLGRNLPSRSSESIKPSSKPVEVQSPPHERPKPSNNFMPRIREIPGDRIESY